MQNVNYCPGNLINEYEMGSRSNWHDEKVAKLVTKQNNKRAGKSCCHRHSTNHDTWWVTAEKFPRMH